MTLSVAAPAAPAPAASASAAGSASAVLVLLLSACLPLPGTRAAAGPLCYQHLSGQAGRTDSEQLRLDLEGRKVSGFYRWIPWEKDRRVGRLTGTVAAPGTARVSYRYSQEGQESSAPLTIVFDTAGARVRWDRQDPGVPQVLLQRLPCSQMKPVPGP